MSTCDGEEGFGRGCFWRQACDAKDGFIFDFAGFNMFPVPLDADYLATMREKHIIVNIRAGPYTSDFQTSVPLFDGLVLRGEKFSQGSGRRCHFSGWVGYP